MLKIETLEWEVILLQNSLKQEKAFRAEDHATFNSCNHLINCQASLLDQHNLEQENLNQLYQQLNDLKSAASQQQYSQLIKAINEYATQKKCMLKHINFLKTIFFKNCHNFPPNVNVVPFVLDKDPKLPQVRAVLDCLATTDAPQLQSNYLHSGSSSPSTHTSQSYAGYGSPNNSRSQSYAGYSGPSSSRSQSHPGHSGPSSSVSSHGFCRVHASTLLNNICPFSIFPISPSITHFSPSYCSCISCPSIFLLLILRWTVRNLS